MGDQTAEYVREIRDFVVSQFLFGDPGTLQNDSSFMEENVVDSTGVMELVAFIEGKYDIKLLDGEILPENLDSINRIANFIVRKRASPPG